MALAVISSNATQIIQTCQRAGIQHHLSLKAKIHRTLLLACCMTPRISGILVIWWGGGHWHGHIFALTRTFPEIAHNTGWCQGKLGKIQFSWQSLWHSYSTVGLKTVFVQICSKWRSTDILPSSRTHGCSWTRLLDAQNASTVAVAGKHTHTYNLPNAQGRPPPTSPQISRNWGALLRKVGMCHVSTLSMFQMVVLCLRAVLCLHPGPPCLFASWTGMSRTGPSQSLSNLPSYPATRWTRAQTQFTI